jgi:hypothetical protein
MPLLRVPRVPTKRVSESRVTLGKLIPRPKSVPKRRNSLKLNLLLEYGEEIH